MKSTSRHFNRNAHSALHNATLQTALLRIKPGFVDHRRHALEHLADADELRARAKSIKEQTLARLDEYLVEFEKNV